jgi:hypothetical protein
MASMKGLMHGVQTLALWAVPANDERSSAGHVVPIARDHSKHIDAGRKRYVRLEWKSGGRRAHPPIEHLALVCEYAHVQDPVAPRRYSFDSDLLLSVRERQLFDFDGNIALERRFGRQL